MAFDGIAPPQGLVRPSLSTSSVFLPLQASRSAARARRPGRRRSQ